MKIELAAWESKGLRCPDIKIDLKKNGSISPVSLLQMPNGTGKTTTLTMLRAAMNGEAVRWDSKTINDFRRKNNGRETGQFLVELLIDDKPLTFELNLDFEEGKAFYRTTSPGSGGITHGWNPPPKVRRFLTEEFVRLFIFDGEFADRLIQSKYSEAERAVDALCQLYLLDEVAQTAEAAWQKKANTQTTTTSQGLTKQINIQKNLKKRIFQVNKVKKEAENKIVKLEEDVETFTRKVDEKIGAQEQWHDQYEAKRIEEAQAKGEVESSTIQAMALIRQPQALSASFASELVDLKEKLDKLRLPASTSRQFFDELLEGEECICGRALDEKSKDNIRVKSERYLAEETSGVLNSIKSDISILVEQEESSREEDLTLCVKELGESVQKLKEIQTVVNSIKDKLIEEGDEDLRKDQERLEEASLELSDLKDILKEITRDPIEEDEKNKDKTVCLKALSKSLREAEKRIAEITGTLELRDKTTKLNQIAKKCLEKAREYICATLTEECNDRLKNVLVNSPLEIEHIGKSLSLKGQDEGSVGQNLAVGYIFLTSLLHRGKHQFPLVVDSPANPIDRTVRSEVAKLLPKLCKQFLGFTISTEKEGFVTTLDAVCGDKVKYMTMFRKVPGTAELISQIGAHEHIENENGALVFGKEYFLEFDRDEE